MAELISTSLYTIISGRLKKDTKILYFFDCIYSFRFSPLILLPAVVMLFRSEYPTEEVTGTIAGNCKYTVKL